MPADTQTIDALNCVVCGARFPDAPIVELPAGGVMVCPNCNVQSLFPLPTIDELADGYQNFNAGENARNEFEAYTRQAKAILTQDFAAAGLNLEAGLRFLDYGCGGGHFVKAASELGADAFGIDLDGEARRFGEAQGLRLASGDYRSLDEAYGEQKFTAILAMHVLEHVPRPDQAFKALIDRLEPGGSLIVRVPDQGSVPSQIKQWIRGMGIKKSEWGFVQPPIHLHGYITATFEVIADMHDLEIVRIDQTSPLDPLEFPSTPSYWDGIGIQKQVYRIGKSFNSGGHIAAILRRPN